MPEVRRLLLALAEPADRFSVRLAWSTFRRHHQAVAKLCHVRRRARQEAPHLGSPSIQLLEAGDLELTDERWERISSLLPPQRSATGRPANDHRTILSGMLWIVQTGSSWRDLPEHFGPWQTVRSRYDRWRQVGIWQQILDALNQETTADTS